MAHKEVQERPLSNKLSKQSVLRAILLILFAISQQISISALSSAEAGTKTAFSYLCERVRSEARAKNKRPRGDFRGCMACWDLVRRHARLPS